MPNMNVVPAAAPLGGADAATTAGARREGENRGDAILHGDEVDVGNRPRHLLDAYSAERERQWPLGGIIGGGAFKRVGARFNARCKAASQSFKDRSFARKENWQRYEEKLHERTANIAQRAQDSAARLSQRTQEFAEEWSNRAQQRASDLKFGTEQFIQERPAQAIGIAAGIGLALGIALRLGRSSREY